MPTERLAMRHVRDVKDVERGVELRATPNGIAYQHMIEERAED